MNFLLLNHAVAMMLTSVVAFVVGVFVLFRGRGKKINLAYSAWSLSVAWWSFFTGLVILADSAEQAIIYTRLVWFPVLLIAVSTAHFVILFLEIKGKELFIKIGYVFCAFFAVMSFTPYMVSSVQEMAYLKYWPQPELLVYIQFFIFVI